MFTTQTSVIIEVREMAEMSSNKSCLISWFIEEHGEAGEAKMFLSFLPFCFSKQPSYPWLESDTPIASSMVKLYTNIIGILHTSFKGRCTNHVKVEVLFQPCSFYQ